MRNELEWALADGRWGKAAQILESINGESVIADSIARKMLAALLRDSEKGPRGQPRKILPDDQASFVELLIAKELQSLVDAGVKKESAKVEVAANHKMTRSMVEQIDKKYRDHFPGLIN